MTAKQYLSRIWWLNRKIWQKQNELDKLHDNSFGMRGIDYSADRVQTNVADGMRAVEDLVDRERELEKELKRLQYRKRKVICQIQSLNNPLYSRVLYLRYVKNMHWDTIAKIVGKGERQVYRIHNQALQSFENKFLI